MTSMCEYLYVFSRLSILRVLLDEKEYRGREKLTNRSANAYSYVCVCVTVCVCEQVIAQRELQGGSWSN